MCAGYIKYGSPGNWACAAASNGPTECSNDAFGGDPHPNNLKACFCMSHEDAQQYASITLSVAAVRHESSADRGQGSGGARGGGDDSAWVKSAATCGIVAGIVAVAVLVLAARKRRNSNHHHHHHHFNVNNNNNNNGASVDGLGGSDEVVANALRVAAGVPQGSNGGAVPAVGFPRQGFGAARLTDV